MTYDVVANPISEELYEVTATITEGDDTILTGRTFVCVATEEEAIAYAEQVFLPDLRRNFKQIAELELPSDVLVEGDAE